MESPALRPFMKNKTTIFNNQSRKSMGILIGIIVVAFLIGLLTRIKGDGLLDTLSSGCGWIIALIVIAGIVIYAMANG